MKRFTIALALTALLLFLAAMGLPGCGNGNSLTSITVTPADPLITKTTSTQTVVRQFSATAHFSDGLSVASWSQVTWQSSDTNVLAISNTGVATAYKAGTAVITAIDNAHPTITGSAAAAVVELDRIDIIPAFVSIPVGTPVATTQAFTATGTYSAATLSAVSSALIPTNMTALVTWSTSSSAIAVISNVTPSFGVATAVSAGTVTIEAREPWTGIVSSGTTTLVITP
ncbi:MAG: hypothetical protein ACYC7L_12820 [Nitrospirota bacterium]